MENGYKIPLISYIAPVYNSEKYLSECINSVIEQTRMDWELILIDDGSADDSGDICDRFARMDQRIKVIHKENSGQFDSRLKGIEIATGIYCLGLDSDDYIERESVEKLGAIIETAQYDIIAFNMRVVNSDIKSYVSSYDHYGEYGRDEFLHYVSYSTDHSFCNKLIRTSLLKESRFGNVPLKARHSEDYLLIAPSLCMAKSIRVIEDVLYNYRQIYESVTHSYTMKRALDYLDSTNCLFQIFSDYSVFTQQLEDIELYNTARAVGFCLKEAYKYADVDADNVKLIRNHPIYKKLSKYEKFGCSTYDIIILMKMFRWGLSGMLPLLFRRV